jgi:hypothetical protein
MLEAIISLVAAAVDVPTADPTPDAMISLVAAPVDVPIADPTPAMTTSLIAVAVDVPVAVPTASTAACCTDPDMGKEAIGSAAMPKSAI